MLFEDNDNALSRELLEKLKGKVREIASVLRQLKEENSKLKEEVEVLKREKEDIRERLERYEGERLELKSIVDELLQEFEQV